MWRVRLVAEVLGWLVVGVAVLNRWPSIICRVFGHEPDAWTWTTDDYEEGTCVVCHESIIREREVKPETAVAA